ncbi:hypothetical protein FRC09_014826 [Ceratobasidium sp. 395]|nr:hypothetical protein FRC09_014826 [Ceratobasidium sp. 395]
MTADILPSPNVRVRHGRQFHDTNSNYGLPNDEGEHARLNHQHEAMKIMLGSNYTAPLPELNAGTGPRRILDIASGSGQWVLEIAKEFPKAEVIGIDLSDPGLSQSEIPNNSRFVIGDITKPLLFKEASFDVVQMRVVPSVQYTIQRSLNAAHPSCHALPGLRGGLILLVEPGENASSIGLDPPIMTESIKAISSIGHIEASRAPAAPTSSKGSWSIATRIATDLRNSPSMWTNINEKRLVIPIGVWTDDVAGQTAGKLLQHCTTELIKGFRPSLIDEGVLSGDQVDDMVIRLSKELEDGKKWKLESPYHFVWAEKSQKSAL